jgi:hypothetical protein
MRILSLILVAAVVGGLVGGAVAYVELRTDADPLNALPGDTTVAADAKDKPVPRAEAVEPTYDFGTMQRGTKKSHEFTIRNVGNAPLKLWKGHATCKCTDFIVPEEKIPPGGTAQVRVEWSAKVDMGPFHQVATVLTDDPIRSSLDLTIDGTILTASGVEPPELAFDKIPIGEKRTAEVFVMAMLQDELSVSDPQLSDPALREKFDVKIEPVDKKDLPNEAARRGFRVSVTAKDDLPVGRLSQLWLSLKTNLADAETLEIPVSGQVVGDIGVHGAPGVWNEEQVALRLGNVKSSEGRKEKLNIVVRGDDAAKVAFSVQSCDPPQLKVTIGEPKKLRDTLVQVPLEIEIPPGMRPMIRLDTEQGERGKVVLATTHPKVKELSIGVQFAIER